MQKKTIFVTGGAGFIGSAMVRYLLKHTSYSVVNIDKLTYAGHLESLQEVENNSNYFFEKIDIIDQEKIKNLFEKYRPVGVLHLAAESHVDRSIEDPQVFVKTNVLGTANLLTCSKNYLEKNKKDLEFFKFVQVSTDEVFGSLNEDGFFTETTPYDPRSPYSASKASGDLLAKAWYHTYDFPVVITHCTNNYGPYHFPEKLIPLLIQNALAGKPLPIYGDGKNIRDWLYVDDHVRGILLAFEKGRKGEHYCIGGHNERTNLEVVTAVCKLLDELKPLENGKSYQDLMVFVKDRLGHDFRYATDPKKIVEELGWQPEENFETGLRKTIQWYLNHQDWVDAVKLS